MRNFGKRKEAASAKGLECELEIGSKGSLFLYEWLKEHATKSFSPSVRSSYGQ